jgi:hypothetical protein
MLSFHAHVDKEQTCMNDVKLTRLELERLREISLMEPDIGGERAMIQEVSSSLTPKTELQ